MTQRAAVRGRRLLAVLALSVVAVGGLSACQGQPGAAAFVGNTRISVNDVENSIKGIPPDFLPANLQDQYLTVLRQVAVQDKVTIEVAKRYAAAHGIKAPVSDPQSLSQLAAELKVGPDNRFVQDRVAAQDWGPWLDDHATPVTPTDADLRGIYDRAKAAGVTNLTFDEVKGQIGQISGLGQALAVQRGLEAAAKSYGVSVSPRYQPSAELGNPVTGLELPLLQIQGSGGPVTVLAVEFGSSANPAVVTEPSQATTGGPQDTGGGQNTP